MSEYSDKKEDPKDPKVLQAKWTKEINAAKKWFQKWHAAGATIEREYLAQPGSQTSMNEDLSRYNIFWANVQVELSAVYTKLPIPEVDRTHLDQGDDVARVAALILERIFALELKNLDESPFDTYKLAIQDRFVPGMGVVWPRYDFVEEKVSIAAIMGDDGTESAPGYDETIITEEAAPIDYVRWDDFFYSPCRVWTDRRWEARRVFMARNKCEERFGEIIAGQISYKSVSTYKADNDPFRLSPEPHAEIFEIWDKDTMCVSWYSPGCPVILDYKDDPLRLNGFFPAKKPLMSTHTTSAFLPRPDYSMVQDQYRELNLISSRCMLLTEAIKVVGVYDKTSGEVPKLLSSASMNQLIPVDNWAMFAEKGGIKGVVDWMPLEMIATTLKLLTERKQSLLQEIYEILGLSDIMRGQSTASETATAQQLKAQYGSARMQHVQNDVAEFITDATRTRAEIICLHWQPQTILERSQIMQTPDAQYAEAAVQLLKSNTQMALRLTVQADTIAAPDWNQEKQLRVDFLQAVSQFITMSMPLVEQAPGAAPFLIQIMQWAAAGFKGGKQIEGVLDQALMSMQKNPAGQPRGAREQMAETENMKKEMVQQQTYAKKELSMQQAMANKELEYKSKIAELEMRNIIDKAISETRNLITQHECKMQLTFAEQEVSELEKDTDGKVKDADDKVQSMESMKEVNAELITSMEKIIEGLSTLATTRRSISITLPDGQQASAEVEPQQSA